MLNSLVGSTAETRAAFVVLSKLPDESHDVDIDRAKQSLELLSASKAFEMSPMSVQASVTHVLRHLNTLAKGLPIIVGAEKLSNLARDCLARFRWFCRCVGPKKTELRGDEAFTFLLNRALQDAEAKRALDEET